MSLISDFVERAEKYAEATGQSLSTVSRKLLNDGKGIAALKMVVNVRLKRWKQRSISSTHLRRMMSALAI